MRNAFKLTTVAALLAVSGGCQTIKGMFESTQQLLDDGKPKAMTTALSRGKFDLSCPDAKATLLSDDLIRTDPYYGDPGITRLEYTVGVNGCNKRRTYVVMCHGNDKVLGETETCFAANPTDENK